jgi:hypothetical protein
MSEQRGSSFRRSHRSALQERGRRDSVDKPIGRLEQHDFGAGTF